ncbi:unnamed protein product [Clavelina lepadiformis]|uniref:RRM domain-containing protein n=1 Tax=Clavelina lepadiformis TaxID=159417 RepID=A0ABP0FLE4_CLALP
MVKIFVGNIAEGVTTEEIRDLFAQYGKVTECDVLGNYGFVHMENDNMAENAIKNLDKREVKGLMINVEKSKSGSRSGFRGGRGGGGPSGGFGRGSMRGGMRGAFGGGFSGMADNSADAKSARRAGCTKLHIANLPDNCRSTELRHLFERYGYVAECDVVEERKIAFVHIEDLAADAAIHGLNGYNYKGASLKVQMSKNQNKPEGGRGGMRGGFMPPMRGGRGGVMGRGGGRFGEFGGRGFNDHDRGNGGPDRGFNSNGDSGFEGKLPPPAKDRMELLDLLDRRRRLEALDPYERRLISCPDPFNLPLPPPEYLRLLRERALVKARLPVPPTSSVLGRNLPTAGSTTTSSALTRALIARRAAAVASSVGGGSIRGAGPLDSYIDTKPPVSSHGYDDLYASRANEY